MGFGVRPDARGRVCSNGGVVRLLLTQAVVGIGKCLALLSGTEPTQMLPAREEILKPPVVAHDAVDNTPPASAHDLCGQQKALRARSAETPS